ncbi:MAG TPA: hypothetical protein VL181_05295, partial [Holophagaceae bacterium]|nr:hypothetical protein [Holophagaceae bacterium]
THDRYLLGRVCDSLMRIHEGQAELREGGYEDNQAWVDLDIAADEPDEAPKAPQAGAPKAAPVLEPERPKVIDKEKQKTLKRLERHVSEAEAKVAELESKLGDLQKELAGMDPNEWQAFSAKLDAQKSMEADLAYAMSEWESAQGALEAAGS